MTEWTEETVNMLNELQIGIRYGYTYTCPNRSDGNHFDNGNDLGCLIATENGWICPSCEYTQDWFHSELPSDDRVFFNGNYQVEKNYQQDKEQRAWLDYFNNYSKVSLQKQLNYGWMKIDDVLNIVKSEYIPFSDLNSYVENAIAKEEPNLVLFMMKEVVKLTKENIVNHLMEKMNETN